MRRFLFLAVIFAIITGLLGGAAVFSEKRAQHAVDFFQIFLKHTQSPFNGKPFVLLPWQDKLIRDVYGTLKPDGTRQYKYVYLEIPKKNGKSELAAGAALYQTFADREINGKIYGCAASREQASLVFDVAVDMIRMSPTLSKRARITESTKKIKDRKSGSVYKVESAEAFSRHGLNLSACVFDELHAQPNRKMWDVMTNGSGDARRQPIWWIITTAGEDPDRVTIGWEEHDYAMRIMASEIVDPTWYVMIFNYDGEDIYNEANWYKANPSLGHTIQIDSFREWANRAKVKPADELQFRQLKLNQWLTTKLSTWLPLQLFDETVGDWDRTDLAGKDCYLGLDLSSTTDLSAIAGVFPPQGTQLDWRVIWDPFIPEVGMKERILKDKVPYDKWVEGKWLTATSGDMIDYTEIYKRIMLWKTLYNIKEIPADRAFAAMLLQVLQKEDLVCVDVPQTFQQLTDPLNQTEILLKGKPLGPEDKAINGVLLTGQMTHENSPVARWCFGNTSIAKNGQGFIKYVKEHRGRSVVRTKRIDTTAAWITAMARARFYQGSMDISAKIMSPDWGM